MIELKKNKRGKYYFSVVASNGRILCHSESYSSKQMAEKGIGSLVMHIVKAWVRSGFRISKMFRTDTVIIEG